MCPLKTPVECVVLVLNRCQCVLCFQFCDIVILESSNQNAEQEQSSSSIRTYNYVYTRKYLVNKREREPLCFIQRKSQRPSIGHSSKLYLIRDRETPLLLPMTTTVLLREYLSIPDETTKSDISESPTDKNSMTRTIINV